MNNFFFYQELEFLISKNLFLVPEKIHFDKKKYFLQSIIVSKLFKTAAYNMYLRHFLNYVENIYKLAVSTEKR